MNKKVQKGLVAAVAATMGASVVAPTAFAASQTQNVSLDAQYAEAYTATAKALESKAQKDLTAARVLVDALYNTVKGTANEFLATTLSSILDPAQQVKLVAFFDAMGKAEVTGKQADINAAQALIIDMPQVWRNSYSTAMDAIQQKLIDKVVEATKKAQTTASEVDKAAAQTLLDEVKTVTNNEGVLAWTKAYQTELDKVVTKLQVASVNAISLNQIQVTFNRAVDSTSATNVSNYKIGSTALSSTNGSIANLSADGKTVTITLDTAGEGLTVVQGMKKTLTIENIFVKDSFTEKLEKTQHDVTIFDNATPTVVSVTPIGNTKLVVKFSEAIANGNISANYQIDGQPITSFSGSAANRATTTVNDGGTEYSNTVELTFSAPLTSGSHTLTINDVNTTYVQDMANFIVAKTSQSFEISNDTAAPKVVNVTGLTSGKVTITFDKDIKTLPTTFSGTGAFKLNGITVAQGVINASNKKEVTIDFGANQVKEGANLITIAKDVEDYFGNKMDAKNDYSVAFTAAKDSVAPVVEGITVVDDKTVKVTFSELVNSIYASNTGNYKVTNAAGTRQTISSSVVGTNSEGNKTVVTLNFASALPGSTYTIVTSNIQDSAGNTMTSDSRTFVSPDKTEPTGISAERTTTGNKIVVKYSEIMDGTAANVANYYYSVDGTSYRLLPTNTTVETKDGGKTVVFTLPSDINVTTIQNVRAVGVKDASGNVIQGALWNFTVTNAAAGSFAINNTSTDYPKSYMDGTSKLVVEFNTAEALNAYALANFVVEETDGTDIATPDQIIVGGKNVKLVFTNSTSIANIKAQGTDINVNVLNNNNKDAFGRSLATGVVAIDDQISPELFATTPVAVIAADKVTVKFNEDLDANIQGTFKSGYTITVNGAPKTISSAVVNNDTITFTLLSNYITNGSTVSVIPKTPNTVADVNGNVYVPVLPEDTKQVTTNTLGSGATFSAATRVQGAAAVPAVTAVAPEWNTGAITKLNAGESGSIVFDGVTVNVAAVAVGSLAAPVIVDANTVSVTVDEATDAATQAGRIVAGLNFHKSVLPTLASYTFAVDTDGIKVTGTTAMGATKNGVDIAPTTIVFANATAADRLVVDGVTAVAGVAGVTETATYTVLTGVSNNKTLTVTLANPTQTVTVNVLAGDTADQVAAKIRAALTTVTGYAVSGTGANIVFTSGTADTNHADLTMTVTE